MASTALSWQDRHPTQRFSLPSSNDIRYRAEHRGPSSSSSETFSRVTAPVYRQLSSLATKACSSTPSQYGAHKSAVRRWSPSSDDSEDEGSDVGSDSDAEDGEDGFDVSMDIDENESSSVAAAHSKLNTRIPLAPLDTLPITGKRKHEDPHAIIPPPTPHENRDKSMMIYDSNDLPDYEFVMGDDEADMEPSRDVLSGLYESDTMRLIIICSVCGRRSCSIPHASLGRLELLNGCEIEEARMGDSPRNESPQFKVPAPTRSAKVRTARYAGPPLRASDWLVPKVLQPFRPRITYYSGASSPLAPRPDYRYRRMKCSDRRCAFVGASVEHWRHHVETFQHYAYGIAHRYL